MTPAPLPLRPTVVRWWRFVRHGRLVCPHGHHIPNTFAVTEAGFVRCGHRAGGRGEYRKPECGAWVFLYAIRGGGIVVAEVSLAERDTMGALATPAAMVEFLGIWPDDRAA